MADAAGRPVVVVIGDVMTDVIVRAEGEMIRGSDRRATIRMLPGGSGANQAAWFAHFGVAVRFVARVGVGDRDALAATFAEAGVEPRLAADAALPSGMLVTLVAPDGERSFFTDRGANDALTVDDLPDALLEGADLVHVSGYALVAPGPRAAVLGFLARARAAGIAVSVDPASASFLAEIGPADFLDWTRGADFCFPNGEEAAVLTGTAEPEAQFARLAGLYRTVVIKRGPLAAEARQAGRTVTAMPPAVIAVDTTGAGDSFLAAFLAAHLAGRDLEAALESGVAAGAATVTRLGGRPAR
ncbi:carbohydrate kinase family protein [Prosthecomicrobium pneumaticum]|uniref:Sugar/nucleoside kinase (Ribokinase family) n=1 Tax=Prosthecomicrobium pneumaticum TaxID=81895 RepID=A0A7W9FJH5_9HYPH|nr:PfkB family carbohydrate kinase [Prosthecomicrobium pneumaticum]MBB5751586.1 sugar/nucleoside kinase (ribokinase family) [Prosthecomicrobium pneumaticum]